MPKTKVRVRRKRSRRAERLLRRQQTVYGVRRRMIKRRGEVANPGKPHPEPKPPTK